MAPTVFCSYFFFFLKIFPPEKGKLFNFKYGAQPGETRLYRRATDDRTQNQKGWSPQDVATELSSNSADVPAANGLRSKSGSSPFSGTATPSLPFHPASLCVPD
jgi:hypothetical protein